MNAAPPPTLTTTELAASLERLGVSRVTADGEWESYALMADGLYLTAPDGRCRTCDGSGTLMVPDSDGESASEQACPDCEPQSAPELAAAREVNTNARDA